MTAMRVLAWIMAVSAVGFGVFTIVFGILVPAQAPHAVHNLVVASLLLVMSAPPVIAVARDPHRSIRPLVILAAVGIAGLATMGLSLTPDPSRCHSSCSSAGCGCCNPTGAMRFHPAALAASFSVSCSLRRHR